MKNTAKFASKLNCKIAVVVEDLVKELVRVSGWFPWSIFSNPKYPSKRSFNLDPLVEIVSSYA